MADITPPPARKEMPPIDLTLAVNYIPAVVCLGKAALISFCLSIIHPGAHLGGFVVFAMLLNLDRAVSCARIFDENALQLCILASWVINFLRVASEAPVLLNPIVSALWVGFSLSLVVEPRVVQEFFVLYGQGAGGALRKLVPGIVSSLMVGLVSLTPLQAEAGVVKSARTVGFAGLCVAWVYVVSVWRAKPRNVSGACVFETHALVARFCPVLYVNWVVAGGFGLVCVACLAYHYVRIHVRRGLERADRVDRAEYVVAAPEPVMGPLPNIRLEGVRLEGTIDMGPIEEEDDEDLEAFFRSACLSKRGEAV
jgi:hypothetical protein